MTIKEIFDGLFNFSNEKILDSYSKDSIIKFKISNVTKYNTPKLCWLEIIPKHRQNESFKINLSKENIETLLNEIKKHGAI